MWRSSLLVLLLFLSWLVLTPLRVIAQSFSLATLGYLKCDDYPGVTSNDTGDSTSGLQSCIDDAYNSQYTAYLDNCAGTYRVSNTLRLYEWMPWSTGGISAPWQNHVLRGSAACASTRPIIKLINGSSGFSDAANPRPIVNYREFWPLNSSATVGTLPSHPYTDPTNFRESAGTMFTNVFENIDIITGTNAGAVGLTMQGGQTNMIANTKITATGGFAGIYQPPAMNSPNINIEVVGGQYGIILGPNLAGVNLPLKVHQGVFIAGLKLSSQTVLAIADTDSVPSQFVGFEITKSSDGPAIRAFSYSTYVDGKITMSGSAADDFAIDNRGPSLDAQNLFIRNVFVTGTANLVKSGNCGAACQTTGSGTWKQIVEYSALDTYQHDGSTDPNTYPTYTTGLTHFESRSVICPSAAASPSPCALGQAAQPLVQIVSSASAPPSDLLTRHVWTALPAVKNASGVDCTTSTNCVVPTCTAYVNYDFRQVVTQSDDCSPELQAAIDAAATAGHNNVHLKRGSLLLGSQIDLAANTKLIGAGPRKNNLSYKDSWQPTSATNSAYLRTANSASAAPYLGFFSMYLRTQPLANDYNYYLRHRSGKDSLVVDVMLLSQFLANCNATTGLPNNQPRNNVWFTDAAGGRFYGLQQELPTDTDRNTSSRLVFLDGNSQPSSFYGLNLEGGKAGSCGLAAANLEVKDNTAGVRVYGNKREGRSVTLLSNNSSNIGLFSSGSLPDPPGTAAEAYIKVTGTSDNILVGLSNASETKRAPNGLVMLKETITGESAISWVPWPNGLTLYKRGTLDDAPFTASPPPASPVLDTLTVDTPDRVDLCWTIFDNTAMLPASGVTGVTVKVNGVTKTISASTRTANNCYALTLSAGALTDNTQAVLVSYAPGNITAGGPGTPPATAFTDQPANNILTPTPQPAYTQQRFAWRSIHGLDETSSPWYTSSPAGTTPNENAFFEAAPGTKMRVRVQVGVTTADAPQQTFTIYWELNGSGTWAPLTNSCASDPICFADAPDLPDSYQALTRQLTSTHATYVPGGLYESAGVQVPVTLTANSESESEIAVQLSASVAISDQVRLRLRTGTGTAFGSYPNVPTITVIRPRNTQAGGGLR